MLLNKWLHSSVALRAHLALALALIAVGLIVLPVRAAVTLVSFTGTAGASDVTIDWQTATELDTAGFNILRSAQPLTGYMQANADFIFVKDGGLVGATYEYVDPNVALGTTYYYKLQVVNTDNSLDLYGPVTVTLAALTTSTATPPSTPTRTPTYIPTSTPTRTPTYIPTSTPTRTPTPTATSVVNTSGTAPTAIPQPSGLDPSNFVTLTPAPTRQLADTPSINQTVPTRAPDVPSSPPPQIEANANQSLPPTESAPQQNGPAVQNLLPLSTATPGTLIAMAPVVVAVADTPDSGTTSTGDLPVWSVIFLAGLLLLGGVYVIRRQAKI
jgi:hypothetical protein